MDNNPLYGLELSSDARLSYLSSLSSKVYKVLHLFEERATTGFSPESFIAGQLWELNAANSLFDGKLVGIMVKLKGLYDTVDTVAVCDVKRQVFEMQKIIRSISASIDGGCRK